MKLPVAAAFTLSLGISTTYAAEQEPINVTRVGSEPSSIGSQQYFTGEVTVDSRFRTTAPARVGGGVVTFAAGAPTAWHTHPLGQTLIVTIGVGGVQKWKDVVQEIRPGDVVRRESSTGTGPAQRWV